MEFCEQRVLLVGYVLAFLDRAVFVNRPRMRRQRLNDAEREGGAANAAAGKAKRRGIQRVERLTKFLAGLVGDSFRGGRTVNGLGFLAKNLMRL